MKLGVMQPYFFPYIGYWQLISEVDEFIVYDDVTYRKGGWINRNNFLINNENKVFSISLSQASSYKLINDICIKDGLNKFLEIIKINYLKAPFFEQTYDFLKKVISYEEKNLAFFLHNSIVSVSEYLSIETKITLSSRVDKNNELKGQEKILHICDVLGANTYVNAIGWIDLYQKDAFTKRKKTLLFLRSDNIHYQQFSNNFIPSLSIVDILMFNSLSTVKKMLNQYTLL